MMSEYGTHKGRKKAAYDDRSRKIDHERIDRRYNK